MWPASAMPAPMPRSRRQRLIRRIALLGTLAVAALLALGIIWEALARMEAAGQRLPDGTLVDVGGHRLHLVCRGTGQPTVVFEAGLDAFGAASWAPVHERIAQHTRACAYSRAGVAWSDPVSGEVHADLVAQRLHRLLDRAGETGPRVLVAHSLGALYAVSYAARYPQHVHGLVLLDPTHPAQRGQLRRYAPPLADPLPTPLRWLARLHWTGAPRLLLSHLPPPSPRLADAATATTPWLPSSLVAAVREADGLDRSTEAVERIVARPYGLGEQPLVVLRAGRVLTSDMAEALSLSPPQADSVVAIMARLHTSMGSWSRAARVELVRDAGHYVHADAPDHVVRTVVDVVRNVRARSSR